MTKVNPEPVAAGKYNPLHHVTAIYGSDEPLRGALDSIRQAGFADEMIEVFLGERGAQKLDLDRQIAGTGIRLFRDIELSIGDETEVFKRMDEALRGGGMTISVQTHGDDEKKMRAVSALKAFQPIDIRYWGRLAIEQF